MQKATPKGGFHVVGDTGIEPVTSSVSGKRATAAPIARGGYGIRTRVYGFAGRCLASRPTHRICRHHDQLCTTSGRRDSNPRPSPWQGDALPLSHVRAGPVLLFRTEEYSSRSPPLLTTISATGAHHIHHHIRHQCEPKVSSTRRTIDASARSRRRVAGVSVRSVAGWDLAVSQGKRSAPRNRTAKKPPRRVAFMWWAILGSNQ